MNFALSGGAILEPLIGILIASIITFLLLIYFIKRAFKSDFYVNDFSEFNNAKKIVFVILFISIIISVLILVFFILSFTIAGLILTIKNWV